MTGGVLRGVAVEDIPAGDVVEVTVGARTMVCRDRPGDPIAFATAAAEHGRRVRAGWNQDDRYGAGVRVDDVGELLYLAWTIIANAGVHQGGWEGLHPEWVQAAIRWRNAYHDTLPRTVPVAAMVPPPSWVDVDRMVTDMQEAAGDPRRFFLNDPVEVTQMSQAEWTAAAAGALERLGLTFEQLAEMAEQDAFVSLSAKKLWLAIGTADR